MAKRDLLAIAARFEPRLRDALTTAFNRIRSSVRLRRLEDAIRTNGLQGALIELGNLAIEQVIEQELINEITDAVQQSGRITVGAVPSAAVIDPNFRFDTLAPTTANVLRNHNASLVQQISNNTRAAIRQGLQADFIAGRNPVDTARTFRANIGLTARQEQAVRNYRNSLENLDRDALRRRLRDRRSDRTVRRAIDTSVPLSRDRIDTLTNRYRQRFIRHRSETIARTEALRAVNMGSDLSIRQMVEGGFVDPDVVRKHWIYTRDPRTRANHIAIPGLNPDGVPVDGVFQTPLGPMRHPHDPNGVAANTVNCRCTVTYRFVDENQEAA